MNNALWTKGKCPCNIANQGRPAVRKDIELQAAVAAMGSGPVGIGGDPGCTNVALAGMLAMLDGTLLHPREPGVSPMPLLLYSLWREPAASAAHYGLDFIDSIPSK